MTSAHGRLARWVPGVRVVLTYDRSWVARDAVAGLILTSVLVPVGISYAEAAGLPAVHGLYATVVPLLVYAGIGPSRHLILGPDSSLVPLIAASVLPLAAAGSDRAAELAAMLAVLAGVMCAASGLARVGYLTDLLSIPIRYGYLNGIALLILVNQVTSMCGLPGGTDGLVDGVRNLLSGIADGEVDRPSLLLGVAAVVAILLLRWRLPKVPAPLVVVVGGIAAMSVFELASVAVVGELPRGLPRLDIPDVRSSELAALLAGAAGIAVVSLADTSVLSRSLAAPGDDPVNPNQELAATGFVNVTTGFFQGFPVSASASRTPVVIAAGAHTQLAGVVGAIATVGVLLWAPGLFRNLPTAVLNAIVITAAISIIEVRGVVRLARVRPGELAVSLVALGGVAVLGVIPGIGLAVGASLLAFIRRAWSPHTAELVRVDGLKGYHDVDRHPDGARVPGLVLFRFDAPLFFANADAFRRGLDALSSDADRTIRWIVVTAEPMTDVDVTGAAALADAVDVLAERGIVLAFAEMKGHVRERLARYGLVERIGSDRFYPTVGEAVRAYVTATGAPWTDWEDRVERPDTD